MSRRTLLKGLLGGAAVAVGLPPLEAMMNANGTAYADTPGGDGGFPRRFGMFSWGNGILPDRWVPSATGTGDAWALSTLLSPLAAHKSKVSVVTGTTVMVPNVQPHFATAGGFLTGVPIIGKGASEWTVGGPTFDQLVAAEMGQDTRFASLEFGAEGGTGLSYNGPNSVNPSENNPIVLFNRLFGEGFQLPGSEPIFDPTLALRRSVLDAVMGDMSGLQSKVGAADKQRLEQHFEGLRAIERRLIKLAENPPDLDACVYPRTPDADYPVLAGRPQLFEKNQIFSELIAMAVACDLTRVFTNWFTRPVTGVLFPGIDEPHHKLTHDENGTQPQVEDITRQCVGALAQQIAALDAIEEGDGTVLDHMVLLGTSDISLGKTHSPEDFPIVLAGGCGGRLKTDMHFRSVGGDSTNKVMLTLSRALGLDWTQFGAGAGEARDGLSGIEV